MCSPSSRLPFSTPHEESVFDCFSAPFFIRANYSFCPTLAPSPSKILPLKRHDLGTVYQVDILGWADCRLLDSGVRGWIPINYCSVYEPPAMAALLSATLAAENALKLPYDKEHPVALETDIAEPITHAIAVIVTLQTSTRNAMVTSNPIDCLRFRRISLLIAVSRLNDQVRAGNDLPFSQDTSKLVENWVASVLQSTREIIIQADTFLHDLFGTCDIAAWIPSDIAPENHVSGVLQQIRSWSNDMETFQRIATRKRSMDRKDSVPESSPSSSFANSPKQSDNRKEPHCLGQWFPQNVPDTHHLRAQHPQTLDMVTTFRPMLSPSPGLNRSSCYHSLRLPSPSGITQGGTAKQKLGAVRDQAQYISRQESPTENKGSDFSAQESFPSPQLQLSPLKFTLLARAEITGGTLSTLVQYLSDCECRSQREWFSFAFFLTFPLFCTPMELLDSLIDRFDLAQSMGESDGNRVRWRICHALKLWLETFWVPETSSEVLERISSFLSRRVRHSFPYYASLLMEIVNCLRTSRSLSQPPVSPTTTQPYIRAQSPTLKGTRGKLHGRRRPSMFGLSAKYLARQITAKQMDLFRAILPCELVACRWMHSKAPNITAMSRFTNNITNWVSYTILSEPDTKARGSIMGNWIQVAHQLFQLRNFDGLVAVVCGLMKTAIYRLHASWDTMLLSDRESLHSLRTAVDASQNYKALRGMIENLPKPRLPFLGTYLTELTFIDGQFEAIKEVEPQVPGNNTFPINCKVINWEKYARTAFVVRKVLDCQQVFDIDPDVQVQEWINNELHYLAGQDQSDLEERFYQRSLVLEPSSRGLKPKRSILSLISTALPT